MLGWIPWKSVTPGYSQRGKTSIARSPYCGEPEECRAVLLALPPHLLPTLALIMFTGLAPVDALGPRRSCYRNGAIETRRSKTGREVFTEVPDILALILEHAPKHDAVTLVANSRGLPWTISGFRTSLRKQLRPLEEAGTVRKGLTAYGLRHMVGTDIRDLGFDERAVADVLGQTSLSMGLHYSRRFKRRKRSMTIMAALNEAQNERFADVSDTIVTRLRKPQNKNGT